MAPKSHGESKGEGGIYQLIHQSEVSASSGLQDETPIAGAETNRTTSVQAVQLSARSFPELRNQVSSYPTR